MRDTQIGDLRVRLTGGDDGDGGGDGPLVVLLHGFGAPGDDLVPLGQVFDVPAGTRFAFPAAPLALVTPFAFGESRAWWMLDQARLEEAMMTGRPRDLREEQPEGIGEARDAILGLLDALDAPAKTVLGGFSQGAMLSCDVALHADRPLAGLLLLSGNLLAEDTWVPKMPARAGMPVFQSHGRQDPLLSFAGAEALRDRLRDAGCDVTWVPFDGQHEIPMPVVQAAGDFLRDALL